MVPHFNYSACYIFSLRLSVVFPTASDECLIPFTFYTLSPKSSILMDLPDKNSVSLNTDKPRILTFMESLNNKFL